MAMACPAVSESNLTVSQRNSYHALSETNPARYKLATEIILTINIVTQHIEKIEHAKSQEANKFGIILQNQQWQDVEKCYTNHQVLKNDCIQLKKLQAVAQKTLNAYLQADPERSTYFQELLQIRKDIVGYSAELPKVENNPPKPPHANKQTEFVNNHMLRINGREIPKGQFIRFAEEISYKYNDETKTIKKGLPYKIIIIKPDENEIYLDDGDDRYGAEYLIVTLEIMASAKFFFR